LSIDLIQFPIIEYTHTSSELREIKEYDFGDDIRCEVLLDRLRADIRALIAQGVNKS